MTEQRKRTSTAGVWIIAGVILLPVLYVMSIGPAAWLSDNGFIGQQRESAKLLDTLFSPVVWLADRFKWFAQVIDYFLSLWQQ